MKSTKKTLTIFLSSIFFITNIYASALPQNISELVENTAPAVVNITSKKEITQRQAYGYGGIPDEMLERFKFINDQFYSESKAKSMIQRGNSINKIRNYLIGKGIHDEFIKDTVDKIKEDNSEQDFFSARKICKKKRIGPARAEDNRTLFYKKDISLLARNGFDFETSRKVMDIEKDEYLKIINLL